MEGIVWRPKQVAVLLDISRATLSRWRKTPGFPQPVQLGPRCVGFLRSDIDAWLASRKGAC
ncbi:AlpA family transcriptional regulator [Acidovorax sp. 100]|uniref:helix-turn-helix transcriptional regulator n=1 Tax=Acidovorax sp. 100 TaxID=2135635 RepID=UPI000EF9A9D5|nr:AlpA family transcriptional regulator [Acidovorax sp. 100]